MEIRIQGVSKRYFSGGKTITALDNVDLTIPANQIFTLLGPSGLVRAARDLRLPARLVDVFEAMLASLTIVLRQVRAMLRAREARRPGFGALSDLLASPVETTRGFGRLVASLLLRSLERAEAIEQARRARGGAA